MVWATPLHERDGGPKSTRSPHANGILRHNLCGKQPGREDWPIPDLLSHTHLASFYPYGIRSKQCILVTNFISIMHNRH
jgi:hypothetical protein